MQYIKKLNRGLIESKKTMHRCVQYVIEKLQFTAPYRREIPRSLKTDKSVNICYKSASVTESCGDNTEDPYYG